MEIWNEILIDPTKQGNSNGGESKKRKARLLAYKKVASENTRLEHQNTERAEIHGSLGCAIKERKRVCEVVAGKVTGKIVGVVTGGVTGEEGLGPLLGRVAGP